MSPMCGRTTVKQYNKGGLQSLVTHMVSRLNPPAARVVGSSQQSPDISLDLKLFISSNGLKDNNDYICDDR
jgi:hypothetical protein